jgi:hypothetical protein
MGVFVRGRSGRFVLLATALGLAIALAIAFPPTNASGQAPATVEHDAGVLLLSTGAAAGDNWVRYYADPTSPLDVDSYDVHQTISVSRRCEVTTDGSLLAIAEEGGTRGIGIVSNGYGVRTKNNCSTGGGRIGAGQSLTFSLGSSFDASHEVNLAEVDVEAKFNADLGYSYSLDGEGGSGTAPLPNTSDNGPDAGVGDNNIAVIEPATNFTAITFMPAGSSSGEVAIEGGGDGVVPGGTLRTALGVNQTLFDLVTVKSFDAGDLDCGDVEGPTVTPDDNGPAEEISLGRGENLDKEDEEVECVEVAYTFRIEDDSVLFDADLVSDVQENANFLVRIDWEPGDPTIDPFNTPHREINYFPNVNANDYEQVSACLSLVSEGDVIDPDPDPDDVYEHPEGPLDSGKFDGEIVPWCLAGERLVLLESGEWQQIQWYDGAGDPRWK